MLQALLVTFREGIESFLIIGIVVAYLKKTQRAGLIRGVRIGLGVSVITCVVGAWLWLQVPNQPLWEGIAALTSALIVGTLLVQMLRAGPHIKRDIEARVANVAGIEGAPASPQAIAGVATVTALLVTREGLEAVFYLGVQALALHAAHTVRDGFPDGQIFKIDKVTHDGDFRGEEWKSKAECIEVNQAPSEDIESDE